MRRDESETKEKIMEAAIDLLLSDSPENITVRDIAAHAGVGVGLINYHFQTKENLIDQCVQRKVGNVIGGFDALYRGLDMPPLDKLRYLLKSTGNFLANNPWMSRTSIRADMVSPRMGDNTTQTFNAYYAVVCEVCAGRKSEDEIRMLTHTLISTLQVAFLREPVAAQQLSLSFFDKPQRDTLIDKLVDSLFEESL